MGLCEVLWDERRPDRHAYIGHVKPYEFQFSLHFILSTSLLMFMAEEPEKTRMTQNQILFLN